jgi:hypothetical protein
MENQEKRDYGPIPLEPPKRLFSLVIRRLGLEKQLHLVKRNFGVFAAVFLFVLVLAVFAFISLRAVLARSSFGPFLSLVFSDPRFVLKNWRSFALSVFESMPGGSLFLFLISASFFMLVLRLVSRYAERLLSLMKSVRAK